MSLAPGTRLGPYEIVAPLGAGGMGEVYRARDTNLGRDVALKTLPDSVAHDAERLARFRREAQVLAALNHPHIAGIYGLEEANSQRFLVLELVDGETLEARIQRGALPIDEALTIAREIAEALEAAHEKGIIHRDLKPANIALTANDRVKVLDFGLAKPSEALAGTGGVDALNSPTITSPAMTALGVILGTAAYMSPEQARGRAADKRTDVWAFGCVLFEMLTGKRAFSGDDVSDTVAAVLKSAPDWKLLPPSLPPAVRLLLEGCLEKNHCERISDFSTARFALKPSSTASPDVTVQTRPAQSTAGVAFLVLAAVAAGAGLAIGLQPRQPTPHLPVTRFAIPEPEGKQLTLPRRVMAVSPDGTRIVYGAGGQLYLRSLANVESRPIPGADPSIEPAFSPDGESIVFWAEPGLKKIAVTGGTSVGVCVTAPAPFGIDWTDSGIVFVQPGVAIMRVSANGGTPTTLVPLSMADGLAQGPQLLPDGDTLLFTLAQPTPSTTLWDKARVVAHSIKSGRRTTIVERASDARYLPTGHLLYVVEGTMMAAQFDLNRMQITSGAVPVVEGIRRSAPSAGGAAQYSVSNTGVLAYVPGPIRAGEENIFLHDRKGGMTPLKLPRGSYSYPRVSRDGKWLAFETTDGKNAVISLYELTGASSVRRLTFRGNNRFPIWSADGKHVAFQSDRDGDLGVFWQPVSGGTAERLTRPEPGIAHVPESWSPRDDVFLFSVTKGSETSLWTFSMRNRKAARFADVTSTSVPTNAIFHPEGTWVAYQSGDSVAAAEAITYVQPFPPTGEKYEIARGGRPLWSADGKELFFVPAPSQFAAVSVRTEPAFAFTPPVAIPRRFGLAPPANPRPYDIMPDGRFVIVDATDAMGEQRTSQIEVVLNWHEELKRLVPTK
jgi:Tol biopolymer transport system component